MPRLFLFVLLLPILAEAQVTIEPRRLDDSLFFTYFYPTIDREPDGTLLCTWAGVSETTVGSYGHHVTLWGDPTGEHQIFDNANPETYLCPPRLFRAAIPAGNRARMIFHS